MDHYLKWGETADDLLIWDTEIHKMHSIFVTWPLQKFSPCKRIQDSLGFQVLDSGIFVSGTWIPDSSRKWDSDSLRNTLDYKALDSGFHKQKFPGFQIVTMAAALDIVAMWISPVRAFRVSDGFLNALTVICGFLKMLTVRMTPTCVVTRMPVPRMDLGAIPLTLRFDGSTATYPAALQEVLFRFWFCKILQLKKDKLIVTPKDILCLQTHKEKLKKYTDSSITSFLYSICFSFLSCFLTGLLSFLSFPIPRSHPSVLPSFLAASHSSSLPSLDPSLLSSLLPFFLSFHPYPLSLLHPPSFLPSSLPSPFLCYWVSAKISIHQFHLMARGS